jgi:hypothetical protein
MKTKTTDNHTMMYGPSKKCPECYDFMPLSAKICPSCKTRVGRIDNTGMARRAFDWKAYSAAFIAILIFIVYIWWAFLV